MSRKRKLSRPSDPMDIARRRAEARAREAQPDTWGADVQALRLPANADVARQADLGGRIVRARRQDVFDLFRSRGSLSQPAFEAVRRLQDQIAVLHGAHRSAFDFQPKVDRSRRPADFGEARRLAGVRIERALDLTGLSSARLLMALCESEVVLGRPADWRATVERETGERLPDAQGARVRAACDNLAEAFARLDRERGLRRSG